MKTLLTLLLLAASAFGQTATISDTIRTPFGGTFSGTVTVSLNSPALAQPLYSGNVTLSGWSQAVTVTAGVFNLTLYTNDLITPGGTSYTATYAPTSGSGWKETWVVPTGATTIREIRSTTVPSPSVRFNPSQITQAGATLGQGLRWNGSIWAPAAVLTDPMTTTGDLITRSGINAVRIGIGSTNQVLTVSGGMPVWASGITGNASTATALAADPANCGAGTLPRGVDASGAGQNCAAVALASEVTGILPNANTTAASTNTASAIVARDASGNFAAGTVTAALAGNASTATALRTARTIAGVAFDGSANISIPYSGLTGAPALAAIATSGSASDLSTGTVPAARGGAGAVSGLLKADGAGLVSAAVAGTDFVAPAGNVATATALQTARTIAGTSFDGTANINIASTGLSDSANLVRNNAANTYTSGSKQTFASNATTAGAAFGGGITADPSSVTAGDFWYRADLGTFGFRNASAVDALVAGGRALTTVGSVPFVTAAGVLGQSANFRWDNANGRLGVGTASPQSLLHVEGASLTANLIHITGNGNFRLGDSVAGAARKEFTIIHDVTNNRVDIQAIQQGVAGRPITINAGGGNLLLGTTTDGGFKLDVADSGSSGGLRVWDQRATIGSTSLVVRAGAGQGTNLLQQWQNSSGSSRLQVTSSLGMQALGTFFAVQDSAGTVNRAILQSTLDLNNTYAVRWSSTGDATGTPDLSLSRASAGVLQVGDGGANSNGSVRANQLISQAGSVGYLVMTSGSATETGYLSWHRANATRVGFLGSDTVGSNNLTLTVENAQNGLVVSQSTATPSNIMRWIASGSLMGSFSAGGTLTLYNETPTTGSTSLVVRAGAGQGGNQLVRVRNSGDTLNLFSIESTGRVITDSVYDSRTDAFSYGTNAAFASGGQVTFGPNLTTYYTPDVAIGRFGVGRAQINNGTAIGTTPGNARDIMARGFYAAETTTDPSAADLSIAGSNAQDTFRLYMKNDKLVVAYQRSGTVNYLTIPLDGATTTFTQSTTAP